MPASMATCDQPFDLLVTSRTSPDGTMCTSPLVARSVVVRSVTRSTMPVTPAIVISSPIVYCPSASRNSPLSRSFTIVWAPKPTAKPSTPAEASSAPVLTPSTARALIAPMPTTTATAR